VQADGAAPQPREHGVSPANPDRPVGVGRSRGACLHLMSWRRRAITAASLMLKLTAPRPEFGRSEAAPTELGQRRPGFPRAQRLRGLPARVAEWREPKRRAPTEQTFDDRESAQRESPPILHGVISRNQRFKWQLCL
jgi:hypothetical protein